MNCSVGRGPDRNLLVAAVDDSTRSRWSWEEEVVPGLVEETVSGCEDPTRSDELSGAEDLAAADGTDVCDPWELVSCWASADNASSRRCRIEGYSIDRHLSRWCSLQHRIGNDTNPNGKRGPFEPCVTHSCRARLACTMRSK